MFFKSSTLLLSWSHDNARFLPVGVYGKVEGNITAVTLAWVNNLYRPGQVPDNFDNGTSYPTLVGYIIFYIYTLINGQLKNP